MDDGFETEPDPLSSPDPTREAESEEDTITDRWAYYARLNIERDATDEQVHRAYKRLAPLLHPDRVSRPELKPAADRRFQALNEAFEVLSDKRQREIYDALGEEGVKTRWDVGMKGKSTDELRAEFERLGKEKLEKNVESLIRSRGEMTIQQDARVLLMSDEERIELGGPEDFTLLDRFQSIGTRQITLKHQYATPLSNASTLLVTSQMVVRPMQGVGGGNLVFRLVHTLSPKLGIEIGTPLLRPRALTFKSTYTPDSDSFATVELAAREPTIPPPVTITIGRRLYKDSPTMGTFTLRSGQWSKSSSSSSVSVSIFRPSPKAGFGVDLSTSAQGSSLGGHYAFTALGGVRVKVGGVVTPQGGLTAFVSGDKRVSEHFGVGWTVEQSPNGLGIVKLRFSRLGQKLNFPIIVASQPSPYILLAFTLTPAVSLFVANRYLLEPRRRRKIGRRIQALREERSEWIEEQKQAAMEAQALLESQLNRRTRDGLGDLIIEEAVYGVIAAQHDDDASRTLDVRVPLQGLIHQSQLIIPSGRSKSHLLGFYDCAIGEHKELRIRYQFKGRPHEVRVSDQEGVGIPQRSHLV